MYRDAVNGRRSTVGRECLALVVSRQSRPEDVLAALADLFIEGGPPSGAAPSHRACGRMARPQPAMAAM